MEPSRAEALSLDVESLIIEAARELEEEGEIELPGEISRETLLFGKGGLLDSMALVRLVVAVEQAIEDRHEVAVALADEKAMSQTRSPYRTVGTLADYARGLIRGSWSGGSP